MYFPQIGPYCHGDEFSVGVRSFSLLSDFLGQALSQGGFGFRSNGSVHDDIALLFFLSPHTLQPPILSFPLRGCGQSSAFSSYWTDG